MEHENGMSADVQQQGKKGTGRTQSKLIHIKNINKTQQTTDYKKHTEHRQKPTKQNIKKNQVIKPQGAPYAIYKLVFKYDPLNTA